MVDIVDAELGYCNQCKRFGKLIRLYSVEASPPGMKSPIEEGLFLEDEVKFKSDQGWTSIDISGKAFRSCEFEYIDDEETEQVCKISGNDMCPFHTMGFDWGSETYHLIDCDCLHREYENCLELKKHANEVCPCVRNEEFYDFSEIENNSITPIRIEDHPPTIVIQKKIPGELVIPMILEAASFIHIATFNIDKYFLGYPTDTCR
jgi:hypothetical protein